ncbi:MAG: glycoside hydrolase family 30 protein [Bacilli bacterium]
MIEIIQTTKSNGYWCKRFIADLSLQKKQKRCNIKLFPQKNHQRIIGFGAAFTEAACYNIMSAKPQTIEMIMKAYFTSDGLNYCLGRLAINSCDFSLAPYTYVAEGDEKLATFDITHEEKYVIPIIEIAKTITAYPLRLVASPWSPPAYMKTNNSMIGGGKLKLDCYDLWARYITRYLQEMKKRHINIEFLTIQNEPEATQTWESCLFSGREEASFIADHLYPSLKENGLEKTKLLAWDHNRDHIFERAKEIYARKEVSDVVWGLGYHWYVSNEYENLSLVHNQYPDKHLIFTEGCVELTNHVNGFSEIGLWKHGEHYGRNMIHDFNNYCEGWIDWNLVVDEIGGPNHASNYCEAPIIYNRQTREVIFNPSYYYIGHFSKYVLPGAIRIQSEVSGAKKVFSVSFLNPNHDLVTIIQNEGRGIIATLHLDGQGTIIKLPAHSITTVLMHNKQRG